MGSASTIGENETSFQLLWTRIGGRVYNRSTIGENETSLQVVWTRIGGCVYNRYNHRQSAYN